MTTTREPRTTQCHDNQDALAILTDEIAGLVSRHPNTATAIREGVAIGLTIHESRTP